MPRDAHQKAVAMETLRRWLADFEACVRRKDVEGARPLFHPEAYSFGSYAPVCRGLEELVERQWKMTWPYIENFRFDLEQLHAELSGDGLLAVAMLPWSSIGYHEDRTPFERRGRVTIVLTRAAPDAPWLASHTHYSLDPGTPQTARPA